MGAISFPKGATLKWTHATASAAVSPASTFAPVKTVFDLLRPQHQYRAVAAPASREQGVDVTGCVLIIEDHAAHQRTLEGILTAAGVEVTIAPDGERGLQVAAAGGIDVVLLDIAMPRMDGYQVCKLIRGSEVTKEVPVVMISGKDGFFDKVRGRMAGTTGYITKPFGPETLMKAVETYLKSQPVEQVH